MRLHEILSEEKTPLMPWPEFIDKLGKAFRATGWKGQRSDENHFMFGVTGPDDVLYTVIIGNNGGGFFGYALGTVEDGDPYIDDAFTGNLPITHASISELLEMVRDGFGLY